MSKPYVRKRAESGKPETFTCTKCGEVCNSKQAFKEHWRSADDHDQRKIN